MGASKSYLWLGESPLYQRNYKYLLYLGNKTKLVRDIVPSEERVRKVTAARRSSRRQQLEQIGVDRVLQRAKDAEARKNFRRRFYERTTTSEARTSSSTCPIGIGNKLLLYSQLSNNCLCFCCVDPWRHLFRKGNRNIPLYFLAHKKWRVILIIMTIPRDNSFRSRVIYA